MTEPYSKEALQVVRRADRFFTSKRVEAYVVGGVVRDRLLGKTSAHLNLDLAVPSSALKLASELAAELGGAYVPLDEQAGTARIVCQGLEIDLSDFRGRALEDDLRGRDFTLNAIAVRLPDWLGNPADPRPLIDPLHGVAALKSGRLRACSPTSFTDDPVRILRGYRLASQFGLTLDGAVEPLMRHAVPLLSKVSGERIRDELLAIFETDAAAPALRALEALGALDILIPELAPGRGLDQGDFHHLDVLSHQLETVAQADRFLKDFDEFSAPMRGPLSSYCAVQQVDRRSRKALIKLGGLLHDVGKPAKRTVEPDGEIWFIGHEHSGAELVIEIVKRLRLSNRESEMVHRLVLYHLRPGLLSREPQLTRRAVYRFYRDLGDDGPACGLGWWADRMATRGKKSRVDQIDQQRAFLEELLHAYFFRAEEVVKPTRLIDGYQLMELLGLRPGPKVGELLASIEEAQAEGLVATRDQALELAKRLAAH
jgi:putative nucleotidyltransferase with HDIG domain